MDYAQNAANRSSEKANSGNARPTNEKNNPTAHGRQSAAAAGNQIHVNGSTSQAGKKFSASLILNPDNTVKFDFSQRRYLRR